MVRTGYLFASLPIAAAGLSLWLGWSWAAAVCFILGGFVLYFFRDPERVVPAVAGAIVSPADGRVLGIEPAEEEGLARTKISIFMSLFDVHVNRAPIAGAITQVRYCPGKFRIASSARAGRENEQNIVRIEGGYTSLTLKQIAGILARRIEFWKQSGDQVMRGERVGMIRFGSRVEVLLEPRCQVRVRPGEHVRAGTTILASLE